MTEGGKDNEYYYHTIIIVHDCHAGSFLTQHNNASRANIIMIIIMIVMYSMKIKQNREGLR